MSKRKAHKEKQKGEANWFFEVQKANGGYIVTIEESEKYIADEGLVKRLLALFLLGRFDYAGRVSDENYLIEEEE